MQHLQSRQDFVATRKHTLEAIFDPDGCAGIHYGSRAKTQSDHSEYRMLLTRVVAPTGRLYIYGQIPSAAPSTLNWATGPDTDRSQI